MRTLVNQPMNVALEIYVQEPTGKLVSVRKASSTTFLEHLYNIAKNPPKEGWKPESDISRLQVRLELVELLKDKTKPGQKVILEENQYEELVKSYQEGFAWAFTDKVIIDFNTWLTEVEKDTIEGQKKKKDKS